MQACQPERVSLVGKKLSPVGTGLGWGEAELPSEVVGMKSQLLKVNNHGRGQNSKLLMPVEWPGTERD